MSTFVPLCSVPPPVPPPSLTGPSGATELGAGLKASTLVFALVFMLTIFI